MDILISVTLSVLMFSIGLQIEFKNLTLHFTRPKALLTGLFCQILLLPLVGFGIISIFNISGEYAFGIMLTCAVPGGATSALITYWSKGDTALSINLTSINSLLITFLSLPFIIYLSYEYFMFNQIDQKINFVDILIQLLTIVIIPVLLALIIKKYFPNIIERSNKIFKSYMIVYYVVVIVAGLFLIIDKASEFRLKDDWKLLVFSLISLNIILLVIGFSISKLLRLNNILSKTIAIETAFQNNTLALALALTVINIPKVGVPIMLYGLIMTIIGLIIVIIQQKLSIFIK